MKKNGECVSLLPSFPPFSLLSHNVDEVCRLTTATLACFYQQHYNIAVATVMAMGGKSTW
jgi:hypothetical protein